MKTSASDMGNIRFSGLSKAGWAWVYCSSDNGCDSERVSISPVCHAGFFLQAVVLSGHRES